MQLSQIENEIGKIVPHVLFCASIRKDNPKECNCKKPETVKELNELFLAVLKGRK